MTYIDWRKMEEIDKEAAEWGLTVERLMENAGRGIARFTTDLNPDEVTVLYGKGNNGGDGLCAARHLRAMGIEVSLVPASDYLNEHPRQQMHILHRMGLEPQRRIGQPDIIIDALLGYNIKDDPEGRYASLIEKANGKKEIGTEIVSVDMPSGMNPDTGREGDPCIKADYVISLGLPKNGLKGIDNIYTVNIGIPEELYEEFGIDIGDLFREGDIVEV